MGWFEVQRQPLRARVAPALRPGCWRRPWRRRRIRRHRPGRRQGRTGDGALLHARSIAWR